MAHANRTFKDSVFCDYFSSDKARLIEAYNAISGSEFPLDTEVELVTLSKALIKGLRNDIAFTIGGRFAVFLEHQSTVSGSIAARLLVYCGRIYEALIPESQLYSRRPCKIPTPEFYVLYNGEEDLPERDVLHLSDLFAVPVVDPALDLKVTVLNIAKGANREVLDRCQALSDYAALVDLVYALRHEGLSLDDAVEEAIRRCANDGIMGAYLKLNAAEVTGMLLTEWNMDKALHYAKEDGIFEGEARGEARGMAKGEVKGRNEAHLLDAARMKAKGYNTEDICDITGLTAEEVAGIELDAILTPV
jgi:hypothetical protein